MTVWQMVVAMSIGANLEGLMTALFPKLRASALAYGFFSWFGLRSRCGL
jgi:hypothetical protein